MVLALLSYRNLVRKSNQTDPTHKSVDLGTVLQHCERRKLKFGTDEIR